MGAVSTGGTSGGASHPGAACAGRRGRPHHGRLWCDLTLGISQRKSEALRVPGPAANQARSWEQHPDGERYTSTVFGCLCRKHVNVLQLIVTLVQQNATLLSRV